MYIVVITLCSLINFHLFVFVRVIVGNTNQLFEGRHSLVDIVFWLVKSEATVHNQQNSRFLPKNQGVNKIFMNSS